MLRARLAHPARGRLRGLDAVVEGRGSAASVEEGRLFALVGSPAAFRIAEASPRCCGEASVVRSDSVSHLALAWVPSGYGSSLPAGL